MKTEPSLTTSTRNTCAHPGKNRFHRWLLSSLGLFLFPTTLLADDSISSAIEIQPGEISAAISPVNDVDYFKFSVSSPQMVTIATKASAVGVVPIYALLNLYDASGNDIEQNGFNQSANITKFLQVGDYYAKVSCGYLSSTGSYRLILKTHSSATPLSQNIQGNLDVPNDRQNYRFTVSTPGYVLLRARRPRIATPPIDLWMIVRDEAGNYLGQSSGASASFEDVLNPGNYFVAITSSFSGDFDLKLTTPDNALLISEGTTSGQIELPRDHDYYKFTIPGVAPRSIRFLTSGTADLNLWLQNAFGESVDFFGVQKLPGHDHEVTLDPGTYFLLVYGNAESGAGAYGDYALTLSGITPAIPEISVQQPVGNNLADGKSKRSFGTSVAGSRKGITKTFVIRNSGTATLSGIRITKSGNHKGDFELKTQPASSLAPGKQTSFKVTFMPRSKGKKSAFLRIFSDDADENPFEIAVTGLAVVK